MPHFAETSDQRPDKALTVELKPLSTSLDLNSNETNSNPTWDGAPWDNAKPPPMIYLDDSDSLDMDPLSNEDDYEFGVSEPEDKENLHNNPYLHDVESIMPKLENLKKEFKVKFHEMIDSHWINVAPDR
jgi:hypothetical protein